MKDLFSLAQLKNELLIFLIFLLLLGTYLVGTTTSNIRCLLTLGTYLPTNTGRRVNLYLMYLDTYTYNTYLSFLYKHYVTI